jgi:hypothetical protein
MPLDRGAQHLVVRQQGRPHAIGVSLPPTGRPLNIGETETSPPPKEQPPSWHRLGPLHVPLEAQ